MHLKSCFKRVLALEKSSGLCLSAEFHVESRFEEARVAVFLHKSVDLALGQIEARPGRLLDVLLCDGFGLVVEIHLRDGER